MFSSRRVHWVMGSGAARAVVSSALILVVLAAAGTRAHATGTGKASLAPKTGGTVIIDNVSGSLWTCGFNPYGPSTNFLSAGILYEPLWYINQLTNAQRPWLATSYTWGPGNKTLRFVMRKGVRWSDGKPLTAADVVFTFRLMRQFPGLDVQAVWTVLSGVRQQGNAVLFSFQHPAVPFFFYIADQNFILPQHIWSRIKNPVSYADKSPVGSGPFTLKSCSAQNITYSRNPHYWQTGKPYVSEVRYPAFLDNQPGNLYLSQGHANWGGQYIPNVDAYYLSKDRANRHTWYAPAGANVSLYVNVTKFPLNITAVRQAISLGLDRSKISRLGVFGYLPPANQTGIIIPTWQSWYDSTLASANSYAYNPAKAMRLLKSAGFKRGSNGMFEKGGKTLSLKILDNQGFTDWVAENQIIRDNLRAIGIDVTDVNVTGTDQVARLGTGDFQLAYYGPTGGPTPYYQYRQVLHSANTAPIGKVASSNYGRFRSPAVDQLLNRYDATTSSATQHQIMNQIQKVMLQQVPIIPVLESVNWYQYDTSQIVGWPTPSNPYASTAPYNYPDWEVVLTTVHQK